MQARFFLYSCCLEGQWSSISRQKKFQWNIKSSKSLTHLYHICLNGMYHNTLLAWTGQKLFKNAPKIGTYFWYLWIFLSWSCVIFFWFVFGFQVALQSYLLKVGILSWNFLWTILLCKKSTLPVWKAIFCPKMRQNSQKIAIRILHVAC